MEPKTIMHDVLSPGSDNDLYLYACVMENHTSIVFKNPLVFLTSLGFLFWSQDR